jgi:hypothetical protein
MQCKNREDVEAFLKKYPDLAQSFFGAGGVIEDSMIVSGLMKLIDDPYFDTLYQESQKAFGEMTTIREDFEKAFSNLKYHYPDFVPPEIYTMISGMNTDLFISDSLIIIGLDFYMGSQAKYRPLGYPEYIVRRYNPEFLVPSIMLILSDKYSQTDFEDNSMLAEMVYYGKAYAFAKEMLPAVEDSLIIWYTGKELYDVKKHEDIVWAHFIQNELLFETNQRIKSKYLGERPITLEIGNDCPGRVGAWLGWEIVRRYQENKPDFVSLMEETDASKILRLSKYKPDPR